MQRSLVIIAICVIIFPIFSLSARAQNIDNTLPKPLIGTLYMFTSLYKERTLENEIASLSPGDTIEIKGWTSWLILVKSKGITGYCGFFGVKSEPKFDSLKRLIEELSPSIEQKKMDITREIAKKENQKKLAQRNAIIEKKFGKEITKRIQNRMY